MPLVGGLAGLFFAVLFGYVTTKKSGTTFAMITLGIGELVAAMSLMFPELLRRRGRHHHQPGLRQAVPRHHLRPADPGVLPDRALLLRLHGADVRASPRTPLGPHAQRGARQPRAGRVRRLQHAEGALHRLHHRRLLRRHRRRAGGDQLRDRQRLRQRSARSRSGGYLLFTFLGGATFFFGPIIGARAAGAGARCCCPS